MPGILHHQCVLQQEHQRDRAANPHFIVTFLVTSLNGDKSCTCRELRAADIVMVVVLLVHPLQHDQPEIQAQGERVKDDHTLTQVTQGCSMTPARTCTYLFLPLSCQDWTHKCLYYVRDHQDILQSLITMADLEFLTQKRSLEKINKGGQ